MMEFPPDFSLYIGWGYEKHVRLKSFTAKKMILNLDVMSVKLLLLLVETLCFFGLMVFYLDLEKKLERAV